MSTRSHIIVKGSKSEPEDQWGYIYHHFDGYPEGVGAELREQFKKCIECNAIGHKYSWEDIIHFITDIEDEYEIDDGIHGDEEYIYVVTLEDDREGVSITCYSVLPFSFDKSTTDVCLDNGYGTEYTETIRNTESGLMTDHEEKAYMDKFKAQIQKLHNVELLDMIRAIVVELTLRETE